jgi:hypothetical protein
MSTARPAHRSFNQGSLLGTFLDPLADKVLLACTATALGFTVRRRRGGGRHPGICLTSALAALTRDDRPGRPRLPLQGALSPALVALIVGRDAMLIGGAFVYRAYTRKEGGWRRWRPWRSHGVGKPSPPQGATRCRVGAGPRP